MGRCGPDPARPAGPRRAPSDRRRRVLAHPARRHRARLRRRHRRRAGSAAVPALPRHGESFLSWARSLRAAVEQRRAELPHWRRIAEAAAEPLTDKPRDPARDTAATAVHHEMRLEPDVTRTLLTALPAAYRTTPDTVLLTALATAVGDWRGGRPRLLVTLESHGRPPHTPDRARPVDLSQTVGWFTAAYPALVEPPGDAGLPEALKAVKEQLGAHGDGLGHGVLAAAGELGDAPEPEISWNYLGRFPAAPGAETAWQPPPDAQPLGSVAGDDLPLPHSLMINALARDDGSGGDGGVLGIRFTWPAALFTEAQIAALADRLRRALARLADPAVLAAAGLTPPTCRWSAWTRPRSTPSNAATGSPTCCRCPRCSS
ncbi:condensation domain-containing protein [Actinomadura keratinilytica]|uniref:condensation domain-containing protein n=1 Tax=Actinomadura keratinilytica TaxID=547461 RepID=UPI003619D2EF